MEPHRFDLAFGHVANMFLMVTLVAVVVVAIALLLGHVAQRWRLRSLAARVLRLLGRGFAAALRSAGYSSPFVVWTLTTGAPRPELFSALERRTAEGGSQSRGIHLEAEAIRQPRQVVEDPDDVGQLQAATLVESKGS